MANLRRGYECAMALSVRSNGTEWRPLVSALELMLSGSSPDAGRVEPSTEADSLLALLAIYDLWMAPLEELDGRAEFQHHPEVVALKSRLEDDLVARLEKRWAAAGAMTGDPVAQIRRAARQDLVPGIYTWLAEEASWDELVRFLALEGGPDADFDDLVAMAQVGVRGDAKLSLAGNYWDEMGRGELGAVHTVLHDDLVAAIDMPRIPRTDLPASALERKAIGGLLVTNRRYQPEALGALGLLEMQAGPRCRAVVNALTRLDAPAGAFPFYEEHAHADPRHGKEWLDRVIAPLATSPVWARGMVRGARWRQEVNRRFFADLLETFRVEGAGKCPPGPAHLRLAG